MKLNGLRRRRREGFLGRRVGKGSRTSGSKLTAVMDARVFPFRLKYKVAGGSSLSIASLARLILVQNFKQSIRDVFEITLLDFTERGMSTGRKLLVDVVRKNTELNLGTQKQEFGVFLVENIQHTGELGNVKKGRCRVHRESLHPHKVWRRKEKEKIPKVGRRAPLYSH
jgi:hypothetical protein